MEAFWSFIDSMPAWAFLGGFGLLFIGVTYLLDVLNDTWEEWK